MKTEIYIDNNPNNTYNKYTILEVILDIIIYALILMMASTIFKNFYIENIWYALLSSAVIGVLNLTIKPLLIYITMPLTILTLGIFYPFVNIIVLKLASWLLNPHFIVEGWLVIFFVSLFISIMKIILEVLIIKPIIHNRKDII